MASEREVVEAVAAEIAGTQKISRDDLRCAARILAELRQMGWVSEPQRAEEAGDE